MEAVTPEVEVAGGNAEVFPHLEAWGWPIALYLFLGGLTAGLMIFSGALGSRRRRFADVISVADKWTPPVLILGLAFLWIDLSGRWNVWRLYVTFRPESPMSWGSWILAIAMVVAIVRFALHGIPATALPPNIRTRLDRPRKMLLTHHRSLDAVTIVSGIGVGIYTGVLLSAITSRPVWDSIFIPPLFLISGIAAAGAFLALFIEGSLRHALMPFSIGLVLTELVLLATYLGSMSAGTEVSARAAEIITSGGYGLALFGLVVGLGLLIPLIIEVVDRVRHLDAVWCRTASAMTLTGSISLRAVVLFAGLASFV